jgi:hypothetical protein
MSKAHTVAGNLPVAVSANFGKIPCPEFHSLGTIVCNRYAVRIHRTQGPIAKVDDIQRDEPSRHQVRREGSARKAFARIIGKRNQ